MVVRKKIQYIEIDLKCDSCEVGYMRPTGECYLTNPPKYPHKCGTCNNTQTFSNKYPYTDYEYI